MHENRETSLVSAQADRSGKANNHNPDMYAREESDCAVVPMKQPNKETSVSAEVVEGRARTKENDAGLDTSPTQSGERVSRGSGGVRQGNTLTQPSEVGAVCGSAARTDLCGGRSARIVPTATRTFPYFQASAFRRQRPAPFWNHRRNRGMHQGSGATRRCSRQDMKTFCRNVLSVPRFPVPVSHVLEQLRSRCLGAAVHGTGAGGDKGWLPLFRRFQMKRLTLTERTRTLY
jgi:hypothetical protein